MLLFRGVVLALFRLVVFVAVDRLSIPIPMVMAITMILHVRREGGIY